MRDLFFMPRCLIRPAFQAEEEDREKREKNHVSHVDPEAILQLIPRDVNIDAEDVGIECDGQKDRGKNCDHFHFLVDLVGEERIIRLFQRRDRFLRAFQRVPQADICADEILEIRLDVRGDEERVLRDQGIQDGALRHQRAAETQDVALDDGNFPHHRAFMSAEDLFLDRVDVFRDVVQARKAGFHEDIEELVEKVRGRFAHIKPSFPVAFLQLIKEAFQLKDVFGVTGEEVRFGEDDVQFAGIGRSFVHVKKGDVDREEDAIIVLRRFRTERRRDELLDREGVDRKIFLKVDRIVLARMVEINPRNLVVFCYFHTCCFPANLHRAVYQFFSLLTKESEGGILVCMVRKIFLFFIRFYQKTLSPDHGPLSFLFGERLCRFHPTCSQYAYDAIARFGVMRGCWMGFKRILRCHPWNDCGYDPVPEKNKPQ